MERKSLCFVKNSLLACLITLILAGCNAIIDARFANTLPQRQGVITSQDLQHNVTVRRNQFGIPLIQGQNLQDVYYVWGYLHATDRINYMVLMRLTAQGRLSEYIGASGLDVDRFMRTMNFSQDAQQLYQQTSPQTKQLFASYAKGVNAWLSTHQDKLPMDLASADYIPAPWQPEDSILLFYLSNFGLSGNLHEEIASLILAQQVGVDKLPWLLPVYSDEPLPHAEAEKLRGLNLQSALSPLDSLQDIAYSLKHLNLANLVASNNWAISADLTKNGAPILANDAHLPIGLPSLWSMVQIQTPELQAAGASIAGIPAIIIGANPNLAWGYTMVMADNQDLFLEQLQQRDDGLFYRYKNQWLPVQRRQEVFHIKGQADIIETVYQTRHGPLLNHALQQRKYLLQPLAFQSEYGIALQTLPIHHDDSTIDAMLAIPHAQSVQQAMVSAKQIRSLSVNMLFADRATIGWQLTGAYPLRKKGLGLFPSPGWSGEYDWHGIVPVAQYPSTVATKQQFLATANNRVVSQDYPAKFSQSWSHSERIERINALLSASEQHDFASTKQMQYDQVDLLASKLQPYLKSPPLLDAIDKLPADQKPYAQQTQRILSNFDGNLRADSGDAALYALFLHEFSQRLFADELATNPVAWEAIVEMSKSYSAQADHLLGREDSPFWDNINTPQMETKADIIAQSLADAYILGEQLFGEPYVANNASTKQQSNWQWGKLHTYKWNSLPAQIAPYMAPEQQKMIQRLDSYLNRGPYPAGGNINTINIASYGWGDNFNTSLIPSLRMIVDFSQPEPLWIMNNTGQSANPASQHYADNIAGWLNREYINLPFSPAAIEQQYSQQSLIFSPSAAQ